MIKGILFDVDGVLVDSEDFIYRAYKDYYRDTFNVELSDDDFVPFVGTGELITSEGLSKKFGIKSDYVETRDGVYRVYGELIKGKLHAMPGVDRFIANVRKAGIRTALATSADRSKLDMSLKELGFSASDFDFIVCGDQVVATKPSGDIYSSARLGLCLNADECLVVEDALNGHKAARNAGCHSLGLTSSFPVLPQILSGADLVIDSLDDFPDFDSVESFNACFNAMKKSFIDSTVVGKLISSALSVKDNAYAPYSGFHVGAALLTESGNIYKGCNVENGSFGGTICAERGAAMSALAGEGKTRFTALAVVSDSEEPAPPCAICRQFLSEFADSDMQVYLYSATSGKFRHYNFGTLLPFCFNL